MKKIYRCKDCGLIIELYPPADTETPDSWEYIEGVDGKSFWYCHNCALRFS